jgi:hypothetical protein
VALLVLAAAAPVYADPATCRSALVRETTTLATRARKAVVRCETGRLDGTRPPAIDCRSDPTTDTAIAAAAERARTRLAAACCGGDRTCGTADDDSLGAIGWASPGCLDLGSRGCTAAVTHPGDVADCLVCAGAAAMDVIVDLLGQHLAPAPPASALARCQVAIADAHATFHRKATKVLRRCWLGRAAGRHANACPEPGDGRAGPAIARAAARLHERVCRGCGGGDGACGGPDDLAPAAIGFLAACPGIVTPDGDSCAAPVTTLAGLADCAACVTRFAAGCAARLAVPAFAPYPTSCSPPSGTCAGGVQCTTSLDCPVGATCQDNGGGTRYCVGAPCGADPDCSGGAVCRQYCTVAGCAPPRCQCPGFGCAGADEVCLEAGELACHKLCTQDSDCVDPFGLVCINSGFGAGICIGTVPCQ